MVFAQTMDEAVLAGVASQKGISQMILSKQNDQERVAVGQITYDLQDVNLLDVPDIRLPWRK